MKYLSKIDEDMMTLAFQQALYTLGKYSTGPYTVREWIVNRLDAIRPETKDNMRREIMHAIEYGRAGDERYVKVWGELEEALR